MKRLEIIGEPIRPKPIEIQKLEKTVRELKDETGRQMDVLHHLLTDGFIRFERHAKAANERYAEIEDRHKREMDSMEKLTKDMDGIIQKKKNEIASLKHNFARIARDVDSVEKKNDECHDKLDVLKDENEELKKKNEELHQTIRAIKTESIGKSLQCINEAKTEGKKDLNNTEAPFREFKVEKYDYCKVFPKLPFTKEIEKPTCPRCSEKDTEIEKLKKDIEKKDALIKDQEEVIKILQMSLK